MLRAVRDWRSPANTLRIALLPPRMLMKRKLVLACLAFWASCLLGATSPSHASSELEDVARVAYKAERDAAVRRGNLVTVGVDHDRVQRITKRLITAAPEMRADAAHWGWEVAYIRSSKANAFVLPGGKMMLSTGLIEQLSLTDDEIAAVIGHEMAHALMEHGAEATGSGKPPKSLSVSLALWRQWSGQRIKSIQISLSMPLRQPVQSAQSFSHFDRIAGSES